MGLPEPPYGTPTAGSRDFLWPGDLRRCDALYDARWRRGSAVKRRLGKRHEISRFLTAVKDAGRSFLLGSQSGRGAVMRPRGRPIVALVSPASGSWPQIQPLLACVPNTWREICGSGSVKALPKG